MYKKRKVSLISIVALIIVLAISMFFASKTNHSGSIVTIQSEKQVLAKIFSDKKSKENLQASINASNELMEKIKLIVSDNDKSDKNTIDEIKMLLGNKYDIVSDFAKDWVRIKNYNFENKKDVEDFLQKLQYPKSFSFKNHSFTNGKLTLALNQDGEETQSRILEVLAMQIYENVPNVKSIEFTLSTPSTTINKIYDLKWYHYQIGK